MENKMVRVPFAVEIAKKITNGEVNGNIVTRDGRNARVICWDKKSDSIYNIVALLDEKIMERILTYTINGSEADGKDSDNDLMIEIPEYLTFKIGDVIKFGNKEDRLSIGIFRKRDINTSHKCFVTLSYLGNLSFNDAGLTYNNARFATEEEKQKLIDALKESKDPEAKECLKMLGIEVKPYFEFKPKDWILIRDNSEDMWCLDIYSHKVWDKDEKCYHYYCVGGWSYQCIPYNDQTAHLLGTTDNWEE